MFRHGNVKGDTLSISSRKFMVIDTLFDSIDDEKVNKELNLKKKKLQNFSSIQKVKIPKSVNATLRDYQVEGLNWMGFWTALVGAASSLMIWAWGKRCRC